MKIGGLCYSKLQMDPNTHRLPLDLSYYDVFGLEHFVISELQTSALFVKSLFLLLLEKNQTDWTTCYAGDHFYGKARFVLRITHRFLETFCWFAFRFNYSQRSCWLHFCTVTILHFGLFYSLCVRNFGRQEISVNSLNFVDH